jgi:hypothetical protein
MGRVPHLHGDPGLDDDKSGTVGIDNPSTEPPSDGGSMFCDPEPFTDSTTQIAKSASFYSASPLMSASRQPVNH